MTEQVGVDGNVFGSNDNWKGLGVFLDSFDNDAMVSCHVRYIFLFLHPLTQQEHITFVRSLILYFRPDKL